MHMINDSYYEDTSPTHIHSIKEVMCVSWDRQKGVKEPEFAMSRRAMKWKAFVVG